MKTITKTIQLILSCFLFVSCGYEYNESKKEGNVNDTIAKDTFKTTEAEGYIVGSFICYEDKEKGQFTDSLTPKGFCILLKDSLFINTCFPVHIYSFNLPEDFYFFNQENESIYYDGGTCGPVFYPDSIKYKYLFKFKYRNPDESEKVEFTCGPCTCLYPSFPWELYKQVIITEASRIN